MKWYRKKHQAGLDGDPFKEQLPAKNLKEAYERTKEHPPPFSGRCHAAIDGYNPHY